MLCNKKNCHFHAKSKFFSKNQKENNKSYNEKLIHYHEQKNSCRVKVPQIEEKPINFEKLKNEIAKRNGYLTVNINFNITNNYKYV